MERKVDGKRIRGLWKALFDAYSCVEDAADDIEDVTYAICDIATDAEKEEYGLKPIEAQGLKDWTRVYLKSYHGFAMFCKSRLEMEEG